MAHIMTGICSIVMLRKPIRKNPRGVKANTTSIASNMAKVTMFAVFYFSSFIAPFILFALGNP